MRRSSRTPAGGDRQRGSATDPATLSTPPSTTPEPAGQDSRVGLDDLLHRLEMTALSSPPVTGEGLATVASAASGHADVLRSTINAQHEAHEMLTMARKTRDAATQQAEEIVHEAQQVAERLEREAREYAEQARQETTNWANEQRRGIDTAVRDLIDAAARDADSIRAEAVQNAMTEAEHTARQYVSLAAASGARDADRLRAEANELLTRSRQLIDGTSATLRTLTTTMSDAVGAMESQMDALAQLLSETSRSDEAPVQQRTPVLSLLAGEGGLNTHGHHDEASGYSYVHDDASDEAYEGRPLGSLFRGARQSDGG